MIVVFGSINVDLVFRVEAHPREGETVLTDSLLTAPGGKGANQAVAAARARRPGVMPVAMAGCIGEDGFADLALDAMRATGINVSAIRRTQRPTGCASITVDAQGRNQIVVASGANLNVMSSDVSDAWLSTGTFVLLQNEIPESENLRLSRRACARGAAVIHNAAPARAIDVSDWRGLLHALVVNEAEARAIAGSDDARMILDLARALDTSVVVTRGPQGVFATTSSGDVYNVDALVLDRVVDTTAAGDTFVGALACAYEENMPFVEGLRFASVAAGLACTRAGAQPSIPDRADILSNLARLPPARMG